MIEKAKVDLDKELASSAGKESACNAGDPGSISVSGRSSGERIGYPLQYSWASLEAQLVKSQPAMQETWIRSPGWEDPLVKGMATQSIILAWRILWTEEPGGLQSMGSQSLTWLSDFHTDTLKHRWVYNATYFITTVYCLQFKYLLTKRSKPLHEKFRPRTKMCCVPAL